MGDMSAEPSMEDILASIKRVIKEGDAPSPRRAPSRPVAAVPMRDADEVLELDHPLSQPAPQTAPSPAEPAAVEPPRAETRPVPPPGISPATAEATRDALGALSRLIVKPDPNGDGTLEGLVRDMLRPLLSDWLDAHLPRLVEDMVAREIARITETNR